MKSLVHLKLPYDVFVLKISNEKAKVKYDLKKENKRRKNYTNGKYLQFYMTFDFICFVMHFVGCS